MSEELKEKESNGAGSGATMGLVFGAGVGLLFGIILSDQGLARLWDLFSVQALGLCSANRLAAIPKRKSLSFYFS